MYFKNVLTEKKKTFESHFKFRFKFLYQWDRILILNWNENIFTVNGIIFVGLVDF